MPFGVECVGAGCPRRDFMPYGEEIVSPQRTQSLGYTADTIRQKFTGYERDAETDLDFAQARMYNKNYGRFTTPDPVQVTSYRLFNPQALNLYLYVSNTPTKFTDPTGQIIKFRNEDDAKKAVELYRNGLTEAEQNAVSYEKDSKGNYVLKIDSKIAEKAGDGSLLKRLHVAATSERVAVVDFLKENDKIVQIKYGVESLKEETSFKEMKEETGKEFAGLFLPEFGGKENPKFNDVGLNSAEKGVSRILLNKNATFVTMTQAIYAETLSHFQIFALEGSAKKAAHPAVDFDEASVVEEAGRNEKANKKVPSSPVKKKP